jgi:hypothetical protein
MYKIILVAIVSTVSLIILITSIFFNSIMGLFDLVPSSELVKYKDTISKTKQQAITKKKEINKRVAKRAALRGGSIFTQSVIPVVGAGIAATAVVGFAADEYCETMETLDNIIYSLEGKPEKEIDMLECTELVANEAKALAVSSGDDFGEWSVDNYNNASKWLVKNYDSSGAWVNRNYDGASDWASKNYDSSGEWLSKSYDEAGSWISNTIDATTDYISGDKTKN